MKFCHIAPTAYIEPLGLQHAPAQLLLAHLVETDPEYVRIYEQSAASREVTILDNSAFELFQQGKPMFDPSKMVELGKKVKADYLVLPDYPGEPAQKTLDSGAAMLETFKLEGFKTFFVPQSVKGDLGDYLYGFAQAVESPFVDYIGISILGVPNAFNVYDNFTQRFLARWAMFQRLDRMGLLAAAKANGKKIHCLGMLDGPNEISLLSKWIKNGTIDSWDSSAAIWAGIEGISFDHSPTGLFDGKVKSHVDFDAPFDQEKADRAGYNQRYIDSSIQEVLS